MLDQFLLNRLAYEPNPEPTEPVPCPEGSSALPVPSLTAPADMSTDA
jgi:hypothetical protein